MNFIVDENLPRQVAVWLAGKGHAAWHVYDLGLLGREDAAIWAEASARQAIIVTRDADFLDTRGGDGRVMRLCIGNCSTQALLARLEALWPDAIALLNAGGEIIEIG
jgi:predicted nuclease of predicted toxin-antitoxin system